MLGMVFGMYKIDCEEMGLNDVGVMEGEGVKEMEKK